MRKLILRFVFGLLPGMALIASSCPAYGMPVPPSPPDPVFALTDFTYQPASPVAVGSTLTFTVTANKASQHVTEVQVAVGEYDVRIDDNLRPQLVALLNDSGTGSDTVASDGIFAGQLALPVALGPIDSLPVIARAVWFKSTAVPPEIQGDPLSIVAP